MTSTPWGNADELRARRLSPGPGATPEEVTHSQRERLYGAMVLAIDEHGYEATRVADLLEIAGVSRSAFYIHFDNKLDCFLATVDAAAALAVEQIATAYAAEEGPWDVRLRAAVDAFVELVIAQPATARLCVVEIHAAGPEAMERLDAAVEVVDRAVADAIEESPEHRGMPADLVHALVGGVRKAVHTRLRRGEQDELVEVVPQLLEWGLGYRSPPRPLKRPRRRPQRGAAPAPDPEDTVERLAGGVIATVATRGYLAATIAEMAHHAEASLTTFYRHFDGKEEAFLAAIDSAREQAVAATRPACEHADDPRHGVRDGIDALFGFLAAEPAVAEVGFVEAYAGGPRALTRGERGIEALSALLGRGCQRNGDGAVATEAIGGAIHTLVHTEIRRRRIERLRELTPTATYVALAPFVGPGDAVAIANVNVRTT